MADTYEFRFRRRYGLPPTDPRFLAATFEEIVIDYWAHAHMDDPKLRDEAITDDFDEQLAAMEAEMMEAFPDGGLPANEPAPPTPQVAVTQEVVSGPIPGAETDEGDFEDVFDDKY